MKVPISQSRKLRLKQFPRWRSQKVTGLELFSVLQVPMVGSLLRLLKKQRLWKEAAQSRGHRSATSQL